MQDLAHVTNRGLSRNCGATISVTSHVKVHRPTRDLACFQYVYRRQNYPLFYLHVDHCTHNYGRGPALLTHTWLSNTTPPPTRKLPKHCQRSNPNRNIVSEFVCGLSVIKISEDAVVKCGSLLPNWRPGINNRHTSYSIQPSYGFREYIASLPMGREGTSSWNTLGAKHYAPLKILPHTCKQ